MESVFLKLVNMSITASYLILAVILFRLVLKKAPKYIRCVLWGLVALRLLCPISIESMFSLIPNEEPLPQEFLYAATPQINTGIASINSALNPVIAESLTPVGLTSANPTQIWSFIFSRLWVIGMAVMVLYALISYWRLRRKVRFSIPVGKNIRLCDHIGSPFILGIIRPKIYLPSDISQVTADQVLAHENAHLARKDHWWKPLGYLLLTVYWFNPLIWVAYILLCRDIELACDERVVQKLGAEEKKAYSSALLQCSIPKHMIAACPLAFGEVGVKGRIKSVLNYKKPAFWIIVIAVVVSIVVGVCFLTNPAEGQGLWDIRLGGIPENVTSVTITSGSRSQEITTEQSVAEVLAFIDELQVSTDPISRSRSENRSKANTITLHNGNVDRSFHFNATCTAVWFENQVKPSQTYLVKSPFQVLKFFLGASDLAAASENLTPGTYDIGSLAGQHLALSYRPEEGDGQIILSDNTLTVIGDDGALKYTGSTPVSTSSTWEQINSHLVQEEHLSLFDDFISTMEDVGSMDIYEFWEDGEPRYTIYCANGTPDLIYDGHRLYVLEPIDTSNRLAPGIYIPVECVYMNPASSYYPGNLSEDYTYKVTAEGFYTDSFSWICNTGVDEVDWGWKTMSESAEDLKFLVDWLKSDYAGLSNVQLPISSSALYQKLDSNTHLLYQDGDIYILHGGEARNDIEAVWGIYRIVPESEVPVTEEPETIQGRDIITSIDVTDYIQEGNAVMTSIDTTDWTTEQNGAHIYLNTDNGAAYDSRTSLDRAIKSAILEKHGGENSSDTLYAESHAILSQLVACGEYTGEGIGPCGYTVVYAIGYVEKISHAPEIRTMSKWSYPVVLSFDEYTDGSYRLTEYWEPAEATFEADIRAKFPEESAEQALAYTQSLSALETMCDYQALLYFGQDTTALIESLIGEICSSPLYMSSIAFYMEDHPEEYALLTALGADTLRYCFYAFNRGGYTALEADVMAAACRDIAESWGEDISYDGQYLSATDWFRILRENAQDREQALLEQTLTTEEFAAQYPATLILIQTLAG